MGWLNATSKAVLKILSKLAVLTGLDAAPDEEEKPAQSAQGPDVTLKRRVVRSSLADNTHDDKSKLAKPPFDKHGAAVITTRTAYHGLQGPNANQHSLPLRPSRAARATFAKPPAALQDEQLEAGKPSRASAPKQAPLTPASALGQSTPVVASGQRSLATPVPAAPTLAAMSLASSHAAASAVLKNGSPLLVATAPANAAAGSVFAARQTSPSSKAVHAQPLGVSTPQLGSTATPLPGSPASPGHETDHQAATRSAALQHGSVEVVRQSKAGRLQSRGVQAKPAQVQRSAVKKTRGRRGVPTPPDEQNSLLMAAAVMETPPAPAVKPPSAPAVRPPSVAAAAAERAQQVAKAAEIVPVIKPHSRSATIQKRWELSQKVAARKKVQNQDSLRVESRQVKSSSAQPGAKTDWTPAELDALVREVEDTPKARREAELAAAIVAQQAKGAAKAAAKKAKKWQQQQIEVLGAEQFELWNTLRAEHIELGTPMMFCDDIPEVSIYRPGMAPWERENGT